MIGNTQSMAVGVVCVCGFAPLARAIPFDNSKDVFGLRTPLGNAGYLDFVHAGEERTGHTDVRHPFLQLAGTSTNKLGYDFSDFFVEVHNKIVFNDGESGGLEGAAPNVARDYNFANQVFQQAGISVFSTGLDAVDFSTGNAEGRPVITGPIDGADIDVIFAHDRQGGNVVNNWYGTTGILGDTPVNGATLRPSTDPALSGTIVFDDPRHTTFAHELGHFLLDTYRFNNSGDTGHSPLNTDLMASGATRISADAVPKHDTGGPADGGADAGAPADPGRPVGHLGITEHLDAPVGPADGPALTNQIRAFHDSPFVQRIDNGAHAADRADFNWVEDNLFLEAAGGNADNHAGVDFLIFQIAPITPSPHAGHEHGEWGELDLPALSDADNPKIQVIDVFSQIARYADNDVSVSQSFSLRQAALDYTVPEFSADGIDWVAGTLVAVFQSGWTYESHADNFISRWASPIDAQFVRLRADPDPNHDGNVQIDAIIAGFTAAPSTPPGPLGGARVEDHAPQTPSGSFTADQYGMDIKRPGSSAVSSHVTTAFSYGSSFTGVVVLNTDGTIIVDPARATGSWLDYQVQYVDEPFTPPGGGSPVTADAAGPGIDTELFMLFDVIHADPLGAAQTLLTDPETGELVSLVFQPGDQDFFFRYRVGEGGGEFVDYQWHGSIVEALLDHVVFSSIFPQLNDEPNAAADMSIFVVMELLDGFIIDESMPLFDLTFSGSSRVIPEPAVAWLAAVLLGLVAGRRRAC